MTWEVEDTDAIMCCNMLMDRLTFWYPKHSTAIFASISDKTARDIIFYFEALAVVGVCANLHLMMEYHSKIIIHVKVVSKWLWAGIWKCAGKYVECVWVFLKGEQTELGFNL